MSFAQWNSATLPVGNDIVDLVDRESDPAALHPRYLQRVFTGAEREALSSSGQVTDRVELWSRWAAKEATFKALAARCPALSFSPRAFVTALEPLADGQRRGWVEHGGRRIPVLLHHSASVLHAVAATADELDRCHLLCAVTPVMADQDPSSSVRRAARRCLARQLRCDEQEVHIIGRRPPRFLVAGRPTGISLSLSHHGAWVAAAFSVDSREFRRLAVPAGPGKRVASW